MPASVEFHTGVEDPVGFACRLLRKAYRSGARVAVTAPPALLAVLDQALWTFSPQEFIPHLRRPGSTDQAARTPIWLATEADAALGPPVLVNLGAEAVESADAFERIIEIVGSDADSRAAGRGRWRHYEAWGVKPRHHAAS